MNDWHEKGELPPKGERCLVKVRNGGSWSKPDVGMFKGGFDSKVWVKHGDLDLVVPAHDVEFKPIKSPQEQEREEFINKYLSDASIHPADMHYNLMRSVLRDVFNDGHRKVKPLSFLGYKQGVNDNGFSQESTYNWLLKNNHIVEDTNNE